MRCPALASGLLSRSRQACVHAVVSRVAHNGRACIELFAGLQRLYERV